MNSHVVIGTAGHVDHGKTALIRHLTGIETDRLADEKLRGITIENGYAHLKLPSGGIVGFIDVPGHERFVKTMLAGSMGIDAVLLIIAADEGIKPQTLEHLNILNHLNVSRGCIVITKKDLVSEAELETLSMIIKDLTLETSLRSFEIVYYSIFEEACREMMLGVLERFSSYSDNDKAYAASRLHVDRVFSVKGVGTIVTGTLIEGKIKKGEILFQYPGNHKCRIKGIEVYGKSVESAEYGQRVALNLSIDRDQVSRGDLLTSIDQFLPTMIVEASITTDALDHEIKHWQRLKLYHGTKEVLCRIALGNNQSIKSGETKLVQLRLESPIYCKVNDPIILRSYSPMITLGGGIIISSHANKRIVDHQDEEAFDELIEIKNLLKHSHCVFNIEARLFERTSISIEKGYALIGKMLDNETILKLRDDAYILADHWNAICENIIDTISIEHSQHPLRKGIQRETLRSKLNTLFSLSKSEFNLVIERMHAKKLIRDEANSIALMHYKPVLNASQREAIRQILELIEKHQQSLVPMNDLGVLNLNKNVLHDLLYYLINYEILVKINDETIMSMILYKKSMQKLYDHFKTNDELSVAEFRDMTGFSRKSTVMLLEHFDRIKLTKRCENNRIIIKD